MLKVTDADKKKPDGQGKPSGFLYCAGTGGGEGNPRFGEVEFRMPCGVRRPA